MTVTEKPLLELVTPAVRKFAVRFRREAMRGRLPDALEGLGLEIARISAIGQNDDVIVLAMVRAELLHIDGQETQAIEQFESFIRPRLGNASFRVRSVVESNQIGIGIHAFHPRAGGNFYHLVDRMRTAGVEWQDEEAIARAWAAVEDGNHTKALAALWGETVRTYRECCWMTHRQAVKQLGEEWLRISELIDAAYCAVLAQEDKLAERVGREMLARRDLSLVRRAIDKLLTTANLRRHFCVACTILRAIGDAIPDDRVVEVASWLLPRCREEGDNRGTNGALSRAWWALEPIARRLPVDIARQATNDALHHSVWQGTTSTPGMFWMVREQMIQTVINLASVLPVAELELITDAALPLAIERQSDADYTEIVQLLCHLTRRGGDSIRRKIGDRLYAPGRRRDFLLGQVAEQFGQEFDPPERLAQLPAEVAARIRLQVQRRRAGEEFVTVPGAVMVASPRLVGDRMVQRTVTNLADWHALVRHRSKLSADGIREMVEAAIELATDSENVVGNRIALVHGLIGMSDVLDSPLIEMAFTALESMAKGEILEPTGLQTSAENATPLNNFRMDIGTPVDLQAIALVGLAHVGRRTPDCYHARLELVLEDALTDPRVEIRRGAFTAVRVFPRQSEGGLLAILLGTRDADANGAATAFAALAGKHDLTLNRNHWRLLLYSLRLASWSPSVELRRSAAAALASLLNQSPKGTIHAKAQDLSRAFAADICASVREQSAIKA